MAKVTIEQELLNVTGVKSKRGEDNQAYLARIKDAAQGLSDDDWDNLTEDAKAWVNAATKAANNKKDIEGFPDTEEGDGEEPAKKPAKETKPATKNTKEAEEKVEKEEKAAPKAARASNGSRKTSACHRIKMLVVKNPKITVEEIQNKLKNTDLKVSAVTVATIRSDTRDTLRVLHNEGIAQFEF